MEPLFHLYCTLNGYDYHKYIWRKCRESDIRNFHGLLIFRPDIEYDGRDAFFYEIKRDSIEFDGYDCGDILCTKNDFQEEILRLRNAFGDGEKNNEISYAKGETYIEGVLQYFNKRSQRLWYNIVSNPYFTQNDIKVCCLE